VKRPDLERASFIDVAEPVAVMIFANEPTPRASTDLRKLSAPDLELVFAPVPFIDHGPVKPAGHGLTIGAVGLQPRSRGEITLRSPDTLEAPRIQPNYLSEGSGKDLRVLVEGHEARALALRHGFELAVAGGLQVAPRDANAGLGQAARRSPAATAPARRGSGPA
jgi:hypothetical protein